MSILKLQFAGQVKKIEFRQAGDKQVCELSLCKKEKGRGEGAEDTFTWIRVTCWDLKEFQTAKLAKDVFVAGCGDFKLRSYESQGVKRQSAEVRCSSFDIEISDGAASDRATQPPASRPKQAASGSHQDEDEMPF